MKTSLHSLWVKLTIFALCVLPLAASGQEAADAKETAKEAKETAIEGANATQLEIVRRQESLISAHRVVAITLPDCERSPVRLVSADRWRTYHDAGRGMGGRLEVQVPGIAGGQISEFTSAPVAPIIPAANAVGNAVVLDTIWQRMHA